MNMSNSLSPLLFPLFPLCYPTGPPHCPLAPFLAALFITDTTSWKMTRRYRSSSSSSNRSSSNSRNNSRSSSDVRRRRSSFNGLQGGGVRWPPHLRG